MELSVFDHLDAVDVSESDALFLFLEGFVVVVGEGEVQDEEVPSLPDGDDSRGLLFEVASCLSGLSDYLLAIVHFLVY